MMWVVAGHGFAAFNATPVMNREEVMRVILLRRFINNVINILWFLVANGLQISAVHLHCPIGGGHIFLHKWIFAGLHVFKAQSTSKGRQTNSVNTIHDHS